MLISVIFEMFLRSCMVLLSLKRRASVQSSSKALFEAMAKELLGTGLQVACCNQLNRTGKKSDAKKQKHVRQRTVLAASPFLIARRFSVSWNRTRRFAEPMRSAWSARDLHTFVYFVTFRNTPVKVRGWNMMELVFTGTHRDPFSPRWVPALPEETDFLHEISSGIAECIKNACSSSRFTEPSSAFGAFLMTCSLTLSTDSAQRIEPGFLVHQMPYSICGF